MNLQLRDGLFFCLCGNSAIFLDSRTNRYFSLPPALDAAFRIIAGGATVGSGEQHLMDRLIAEHVLVRVDDASPSVWRNPIPRPTGDLSPAPTIKPSIWMIARAIGARVRARHMVDIYGIAAIRRSTGRRFSNGRRVSADRLAQDLRQLRSAFKAADRFVPARDQCLPRSIAMQMVARSIGVDTTVVLGVRANAFSAHCWVEWEDSVISGDFEQAKLFTPIMSIE